MARCASAHCVVGGRATRAYADTSVARRGQQEEANLSKDEINLENQVGRTCVRGSARRTLTLRLPRKLRGFGLARVRTPTGVHSRVFLQKCSTTMARWRARSSLNTKPKTLSHKPFSKDTVVQSAWVISTTNEHSQVTF